MPESRRRRRRGSQGGSGSRASRDLSIARPRRRRTNYWYLGASVAIAVLVIAGFALGSVNFGGGGGSSQTGSEERYVEGLGVAQTVTADQHVPVGDEVEYSSSPPTSGNHWPPGAQSSCGFYEEGLADERAVHNLEHGNIVLSYNLKDPESIRQLRDAFDDIGLARVWGLARFYDEMPEGQVAVAAWGVIDTMEGVDPERIKVFFEAYAGNLGPEQVPC